ncbi:hypothetical protein BD779DRAFT_1496546 [Infundibulicybe gibba]|nr:hypothetical protein BD779DRAFT_1496546 [Infundibulicybe gibba]
MFSSPTPAPGSRAIASSALRSAGLIDRDAPMRDVTDKPGGRKGSSKIRAHRPRAIDAFKDSTAGPSNRMLASRMQTSHSGPSDPLSIRGASRPTVVGRMRRNAVSANGTIEVTKSNLRPPTVKYKSVELWREFVQSRWDRDAGFLNLDAMIDDEFVKKNNLTPPGYGGSTRDAAVLYKLASQLKPEIKSLSLANNRLNGHHLSNLSHYLPRLANLSLQNNQLKAYKDIDILSPRKEKLSRLRELVLIGNPLRETELQKDHGSNYQREITRRLPSLEVLDQETLAQISFDVSQPSNTELDAQIPTSQTFPCEMGPSFITGVDGTLLSNFLIHFFKLFDTERSALANVYDTAATFSYSANTNVPIRARLEGHHYQLPNQRKLDWTPWYSGSRNLNKINNHSRAVRSLHIGTEAIVAYITTIPPTKHDIGGPPDKFCVDSFPVPHGQGTGLLLSIHGEFTEVGADGIRSFDRTFILAPALPGSRAKTNGWDVVIMSDQWVIRGYSSCNAWKPGPMLVQALPQQKPQRTTAPEASQPQTAPISFSSDQQADLASIPEVQRVLVIQVCERTQLNVKFSVDCLSGNGWDLERAVANFHEVKGTLTREAFL